MELVVASKHTCPPPSPPPGEPERETRERENKKGGLNQISGPKWSLGHLAAPLASGSRLLDGRAALVAAQARESQCRPRQERDWAANMATPVAPAQNPRAEREPIGAGHTQRRSPIAAQIGRPD